MATINLTSKGSLEYLSLSDCDIVIEKLRLSHYFISIRSKETGKVYVAFATSTRPITFKLAETSNFQPED